MNKKILLALILFLGVMLTSCMGPLTVDDNGRTIELSEDSPFTIELLTPDTQSKWELLQINESVIKQLGDATVTKEGDKKLYEFQFQAIADGTSKVLIGCIDEESPALVKKTFEITVICGTMGRIESD